MFLDEQTGQFIVVISTGMGIWEGGYYLKCSVAATEYGWKMGWKMIARNNRIWLAIQ